MDNMRKLADTITKDGDVAIDQARESWRSLSTQGKESLMGAQKSAEEAWEDAQNLLRKHPGKAVGLAFVIGAALGALFMFRKND